MALPMHDPGRIEGIGGFHREQRRGFPVALVRHALAQVLSAEELHRDSKQSIHPGRLDRC
jgi:hypothetical protein